MPSSPFDEIIERRSSGALKWTKYDASKLPLWVADSDFKCASPILNALQQRTEHGVMGYHNPEHNHELTSAVVNWLARKHRWQIDPEWIVWIPGVVSGFNIACQAFCEPGDKVLVQTPNYGPLRKAPALNQLETLTVSTRQSSYQSTNNSSTKNRWVLDMDELEQKAADPRCKLFLFCNPMNPCGSVFTKKELAHIEAICLQHGVTLCSDEIHCDLVLDKDSQHIPAGTLPNIGEQAITMMAPSKTFNIAGLGASYAIIRGPKVRQRYYRATLGVLPWINVLGQTATVAALTECDDWLTAQLQYLRSNRDFLATELNQINGLEYHPSEATFLAWVDARGLGVKSVHKYMLDQDIAPSEDFGHAKFTRLNFACPKNYLEQVIERLKG